MCDDLMKDLDLCAEGEKTGYHGAELCGLAYAAIKNLTAQLAALQSENAEKGKEIKRLKSELLEAREDYMASEMEREQGLAAITRVEAERDAAMAEIPHQCHTCKHKPQKYGVCGMGCEVGPLEINHAQHCKWEWRGAQGEG